MSKDFFKDIDLSLLDDPAVKKQLARERKLNALLKTQGSKARRLNALKKLSPALMGALLGILLTADKDKRYKTSMRSMRKVQKEYKVKSFANVMKSINK